MRQRPQKSPRVAVRPSLSRPSRAKVVVASSAVADDVLKARQDLIAYLRAGMNDKKSPTRRRDEMAFTLQKVVGAAMPRTERAVPATPPREKREPKPRVSTYVSKKKQADDHAKTASNGSAWDGLVNGSAGAGRHDDADDDEDDE